jgi:hypothetical protein
MIEFMRSTSAQAVIWVTLLLVLVAVGAYVATRFRRPDTRGGTTASDLLTGFRDLHDRGQLSPAEFCRIKSMLGEKLQDELSSEDADGKG